MAESLIYKYAAEVYDFLENNSTMNNHEERVYIGRLTKAYGYVDVPTGYRGTVSKLLQSPGDDPCIRVIQRGTGAQNSVIEVRHRPPVEWQEVSAQDLTGGTGAATIQGMDEHERRIRRLENSLKEINVVEALRNMELRISRLEGKTGEHQE